MKLEVKSQPSLQLCRSPCERSQVGDRSRFIISAQPRFPVTSGVRPNVSRIRCYGGSVSGQLPDDGETFPLQRPRRDHAGLGPSLQLSKEEAVEMQLNVSNQGNHDAFLMQYESLILPPSEAVTSCINTNQHFHSVYRVPGTERAVKAH